MTGAFLRRLGVVADAVRAFRSMAIALDRVAAGDGLSVVYGHVIGGAVADGRLAVIEVPGTPLSGSLYAIALCAERRSPIAAALLRWITTPFATHIMQNGSRGVLMIRFRPPVHLTLWH